MESTPKISVVLAAYNVEKYIRKCLESLVHQTYSNLEIVIVNDGSKDGTQAIIEEYAKQDNRIIAVKQENQGLSATRNRGLSLATGEYILLADTDDWLELDTCERCIQEILKENADALWYMYIREYEDHSLPKKVWNKEKFILQKNDITQMQRRLFGPYTSEELASPENLDALSMVWTKIYKKEKIQNILFKTLQETGAPCEDVFFNIEVLNHMEKVICYNRYFYHYRKTNPNAITQSSDHYLYDNWKKAYYLMQKEIENHHYDASYMKALQNRFAINFMTIGLKLIKSNDAKKEKMERISAILHDELYHDCVKQLECSSMPIYWRIFFSFAKHRFTFFVFLLLKIMCKLASKK